MSASVDSPGRVKVSHSRKVVVSGLDEKPALEMTCVDGEVVVSLLPRNGSKRQPVRIDDLREACDALNA